MDALPPSEGGAFYRVGMRRLTLLLAVPLIAFVIVGCSPLTLVSDRPTLTNRQDALDAVEAAYARYLEEADAVRITEAAQSGLTASGGTEFDVAVERFSDATIVAHVCENVSAHASVDASGASTVNPGRPARRGFEVIYAVGSSLVMTSRTELPREDACGDAPMFDDESEARAAAEQAYGAYIGTLGLVFADGGHGADRVTEHVTPEWFDLTSSEFEAIASDGLAARPDSTVGFFLAAEPPTITHDVLRVLMCVDFTNLRFTNVHGETFELISRNSPMAIDVVFRQTDRLLIAVEAQRPDSSACEW